MIKKRSTISRSLLYATTNKTQFFTFLSFLSNLFTGTAKLGLGLFFSSYWFIINGFFYIVLSAAKGHLVHSSFAKNSRNRTKQSIASLQKTKKRTAWFLILLGILYLLVSIWMYQLNQQIVYPDYILYGLTAVSFYKTGSAIAGLIKFRKKDQLVTLIKLIRLAEAGVSIVTIQCALLTMQQSPYAAHSSAFLGIIVSFSFIVSGSYLCLKHEKMTDKFVIGNNDTRVEL